LLIKVVVFIQLLNKLVVVFIQLLNKLVVVFIQLLTKLVVVFIQLFLPWVDQDVIGCGYGQDRNAETFQTAQTGVQEAAVRLACRQRQSDWRAGSGSQIGVQEAAVRPACRKWQSDCQTGVQEAEGGRGK
jgi:hypothetical protein